MYGHAGGRTGWWAGRRRPGGMEWDSGGLAADQWVKVLEGSLDGATKISIEHIDPIDRRIGLRCSAYGRTLIRQGSVS